MNSTATEIPGVIVFEPARFEDSRGYFSETFNARVFEKAGLPTGIDFVQDNHSYSAQRGTIRGLHYQAPPQAQAKLVRVVRGAIKDVVVDVRRGSPSYGMHVGVELSADNGRQIYVPEGCLHGFVTLTDDAEVVYKVNSYYSKECEGCVLWNDPDLGIDWGVDAGEASLSAKDAQAMLFKDFASPFHYP
ncbi:dTDP-4-dehydrorhamnose 3,5-epimerase [Maricaulis sp. CAU 1757]